MGKLHDSGILTSVVQDLSGRSSEPIPPEYGPLLTTPAYCPARAVELPASATWRYSVTDPMQKMLQSTFAVSPSYRCMWLITPPWGLCACIRAPRGVLSGAAAYRMRALARVMAATATPTRALTPNMRYIVRHEAMDQRTCAEDPDDVYMEAKWDMAGPIEIFEAMPQAAHYQTERLAEASDAPAERRVRKSQCRLNQQHSP